MNNKIFLQRSKTLTACSSKTSPIESLKTQLMNTHTKKPISIKQFELNKQLPATKPRSLKSSLTLKTIKTIKNNNKGEEKENEFNLLESLRIISEIQEFFESSGNENKKPIEDIKRLLTTSLSLENYISLTVKEKEIIENDILKSSDLRIENYQIAFSHIFNSLEKIKRMFTNIVEDNNLSFQKENSKEKRKGKRVYINERDNVIYDDEETDFCEKIMTEKTQILPLNSSIINSDEQRVLKNESTFFLLNTANSLPEKDIISPLSHLSSSEKQFKPYSSFEYLDTFPDSLIAMSKSKTTKKEECIIY